MNAKKISIIIISVLIGSILIFTSIYAYLQLKSDKEVFNTDLYSLIPADAYAILELHDTDKWKGQSGDNQLLNALVPEDKILELALQMSGKKEEDTSGKEEAIVAYLPEGSLVLKKINQTQFKQVNDVFFPRYFSTFPPKNEEHKEVKICIQATGTEDFFCYAYHQGAFIGSYSKTLLIQAIDLFHSKTGLRNDSAFNVCLESAGKNAPAALFLSEKCDINRTIPYQSWLAGDLNNDYNTLKFNGFVQNKKPNHVFNILVSGNKAAGTTVFYPELLPQKTSYITHIFTDSISLKTLMSKQIQCNFSDSVLFNSLTGEIGIILFDTADSLQNQLAFLKINSSFVEGLRDEISSIPSKNSVYTKRIASSLYPSLLFYETSQSFGFKQVLGDLFQLDTTCTFALYKDFLLLSSHKRQIEQYIEQVELPDSVRANPLPEEIISTLNNSEGLRLFIVEKKCKNQRTTIIKKNSFPVNRDLFLYLSITPSGIYFDCNFL